MFTNDTARPWVEAIAIKGERVVGVGDVAAIAAMTGPATRVIDAGERVLVPGFNDARVDLPLDELPTPANLSALDRAAVAQGITSLQVVAGGPMRTLVEAARQATRQTRWRLIRSPEDTATLSTTDPTAMVRQDEEPFLPPQPGVRLVASGVAWVAKQPIGGRRPIDEARIRTVVGWAYGAEDPVVMAGAMPAWLDALNGVGLAEVWKRKRPRFDTAYGLDDRWVPGMAKYGAVLTITPEVRESGLRPGPLRAWYPLAPFVDAGLVLAAGSGDGPSPMRVVAAIAAEQPRTPGPRTRQLSREEAVRAATWGSAYAEMAERDKGWLGPGTLADIAILSDDVFAVPADRLAGITSVLTLVGGAIVYDAGVLPRTGKRDGERSNQMNQVFPPREAGQRNTALARRSHQLSRGRSQADPR